MVSHGELSFGVATRRVPFGVADCASQRTQPPLREIGPRNCLAFARPGSSRAFPAGPQTSRLRVHGHDVVTLAGLMVSMPLTAPQCAAQIYTVGAPRASDSRLPPGQRQISTPCILLFLARRIDDPDRARHGSRDGPGTLAWRPGDHDDGRLGGRLIGHGGGYIGRSLATRNGDMPNPLRHRA
jgi:hypothetical protein